MVIRTHPLDDDLRASGRPGSPRGGLTLAALVGGVGRRTRCTDVASTSPRRTDGDRKPLGILGGVETFGLLGLFVGPAVMAALILLWRDFTEGGAEPAR